MSEKIVLLGDDYQVIGEADKLASHHMETPLHLAFSCYVFNDNGEFLTTQRALSKKVWPSVWTNSVCGHPAPGEKMEDAITRRLDYELGMTATNFELLISDYRYVTPAYEGVVENEYCPVYKALATSEPNPNPDEIEDYEWVKWQDFVDNALSDNSDKYSWWCKDQIRQFGNLAIDLN